MGAARLRLRVVLALLVVFAAAAPGARPATVRAGSSPYLQEWPVPYPIAAPQFVTAGPGNTVWATSPANYVYDFDATDGALLQSYYFADADFSMGRIARGNDGDIYVTDPTPSGAQQTIIQINPSSGATHEFPIGSPPGVKGAANPYAISAGPPGDGDVYFTTKQNSSRLIGRLDPGTGTVAWISLAVKGDTAGMDFQGSGWTLTLGPDSGGATSKELWFVYINGSTGPPMIGRLLPPATSTSCSPTCSPSSIDVMMTLPPASQVWSMAQSSAGVWYTDADRNVVGFVAASGGTAPGNLTPDEFPEPVYLDPTDGNDKDDMGPRGIAFGPDGNLWVAIKGSNRIAMFNPNSNPPAWGAAYRTQGQPVEHPLDLAPGPDGNLWYVSVDQSRLGRIVFNPPAAAPLDKTSSPFTVVNNLLGGPVYGGGTCDPSKSQCAFIYAEADQAASLRNVVHDGFPFGIEPESFGGSGYMDITMAGAYILQRIPVATGVAPGGNPTTCTGSGAGGANNPWRSIQLGAGDRPQMLATGIGSTGDIWTTDAVNNSVWEIQEDHAGGCETATLHTSETGASGLAATDCAAGKQFGQSALCLAGFYGIASEGDGNLGLAEFAASSVADISTATTTSAVMPETAVGDDAGITGATNVGGTIWYTGFRDGKIWASKGALNPTAVFACADDCGPYGIVTEGSDVWFTEQRDGKVVELDSSGRELLEVSLGNVQPTGIAVGNDGNIWVTEFLTGQVARISVSGGTATVTPFNLPYDARSYPMWISAGPAGSNTIWVTLPYRNEIAVMNS